MQTAEFTEEMDDLFTWLDDVDNILNTAIRRADDEFLEDLLDRVKVSTYRVKVSTHRVKITTHRFKITTHRVIFSTQVKS